jgi:hypothetical protein
MLFCHIHVTLSMEYKQTLLCKYFSLLNKKELTFNNNMYVNIIH